MKRFDTHVFVTALASVSLVLGCSGSSSSDDPAAPSTKVDELETCSASPARQTPTPTNVDAYYALSEGAWLGCPGYEHPESFGPRPPGEVGIELSRNGTYTILVRGAEGSLERGTGIDYTGTWYPTNTDGMVETEYVMAVPVGSGGTSFYRPRFTEDPRQLRIDEGLVLFSWSRYVPVDLP